MNKIIGIVLGVTFAASLILTGAGCISTPSANVTEPDTAINTMPEGQNVTPENPAGFTMPAWDNNNLPDANNAAK